VSGRLAVQGDGVVGVLCAIGSVILFASFTLGSRLGLSGAARPVDLLALRFGVGGLLLLPILVRHGLTGVRLRTAIGLACFGGLGFALLAYAGFSMAPAAHGAALLHGTLPLTTAVIVRVSSRARLADRPVGPLMIGAGVVLIAFDSWVDADGRQLLGDACLLLASCSWSAYGVLSQRSRLPAAQGAAIVAVFSMVAFMPVYALWPDKALLHLPYRELLTQVLVQGVLVGAVSILVYTRAVAALGPARTALFTAAVPCITTLAAVPLLSERPGPQVVIGIAIVTLGLTIQALRSSRVRRGTASPPSA
jgi:drug/metabolite transporter (DMT)-like permease